MNPRRHMHSARAFPVGVAILLFVLMGTCVAAGPQEKLLYSFQGPSAASGQDGEGPGSLIPDGKGNLYGVTVWGGICLQTHFESYQCGTFFELSPPTTAGGSWTETVLYEFGTNPLDGQSPVGNLVRDKAGNFYGVTAYSGGGETGNFGCGNFFELSPPAQAGGPWTEAVLYNFAGWANNDGCNPLGTLVMDAKGNIFGATIYGGALASVGTPKGYSTGGVFEMSPPATAGGAWTESFTQNLGGGIYPAGGLTIDARGILYGDTTAYGSTNPATIFQLIPPASPGGSWMGTALYSFQGGSDGSAPGGLVVDGKGNIYGVTQDGGTTGSGTAFELTPAQNGSTWSKSILYSFHGGNDGYAPLGRMTFDKTGNLYGTTLGGGGTTSICPVDQGCGTVFQLIRGASGWKERVVYRFQGPYTDGSEPQSTLLVSGQKIYGTTAAGGTVSPIAYGTIFEIQ